ncbi:MAG: flagellar hook capping FlgD N-terminal domain-containing protein [Phycisphaerales bacterium]
MSSIGGVGSASSPVQTTNGFGSLDSDEFMKIIFTELQTQDPLQPNDTNALLEQLSTIRSIESDLDLSQKLQTFVSQNEVVSAAGLVGKFVAAKGPFGSDQVGFVDSVLITSQGPKLNLSNGAQVDFDRITEIIDPQLIGGAAPEPEPEGDDGAGDPAGEGEGEGSADPPEEESKPEEEGEQDPPGGA